MSLQSSDSAHCAASVCVCVCVCVLMLNVYIGAWTIQSVPTKTDCLGTCPQRERTVPGLALARNHIPLHLTMLSTASFPKPWRPHR